MSEDIDRTEQKSESHTLWMGYALWLFGFTGAHRFYYGKRITGTIWYCTLGLLGVGWLVDLLLMPLLRRSARRRYHDGPYSYEVAWLLQTFLGVFGLHRMYLGKWVSGVIWLLTGGLFLVGYLYDYLTLNEQVSVANRERLAEA